MRTVVALALLAVLPRLARGEEAWRWKDVNGTLCYSNRPDVAPKDASLVTTRLVIEADHLPGAPELARDQGTVIDPATRHRKGRASHDRQRPIYGEERLRFGCYASSILYSGGWAHPDDITVVGNCLPYLLGPEAWLNAARAELGLREHGLDWRTLAQFYAAERPEMPRRTATVSVVR